MRRISQLLSSLSPTISAFFGAQNDGGYVVGQSRGCDRPRLGDMVRGHHSRRHRKFAAYAAAIGQQGVEIAALLIVAVPDEIDQSLAWLDRTVEGRDWINEDVAIGGHVVGDCLRQPTGQIAGQMCTGAPGTKVVPKSTTKASDQIRCFKLSRA